MAILVIKGKERKTFSIGESTVTIGRNSSNLIKLDDQRASRKHCSIQREGDSFWLEDVGSSHGTFLNGSAIEDKQELKEGDEIRIGKTVMIFTLKESHEITSVSEILSPGACPPALCGGGEGEEEGSRRLQSALGESLARDQQNLKALYEINQLIGSIFDLNDLLNRIIDVALKVIQAERGFIVLKDEKTGELIPKAVRNRDAQKITISKTIVNRVFQTGESVITDDAMSDDRFTGGSSIVDYHIRSCLCVPLKSKDKILGIIHVDNEVSTRSFTEEDLELLSVIGAQAGVVVENAELYEANLRSERLAAIGQTVAGLSHYIKNILTGVEGGKTVVEMGLDKKNEELLKKGWKIVRSSNEKISQLVLNMLDFSKEREPVREKSNVNDIVRDVVSLVKERCKEKSIRIKPDLDENIPEIEIDPTGIHRSILNIVTNAIDAVEEGKGEITLATSIKSLSHIQISISDNGCGIPEEEVPKIFDVFESTKGAKGTGLGLAVTKKIIGEHEGEIKVESKVGQGTTFTITL